MTLRSRCMFSAIITAAAKSRQGVIASAVLKLWKKCDSIASLNVNSFPLTNSLVIVHGRLCKTYRLLPIILDRLIRTLSTADFLNLPDKIGNFSTISTSNIIMTMK